MSALLRAYGSTTTLYFPLLDYDTPAEFVTTASFAAGDSKISKGGGAFTNTTNTPAHVGNGIYSLALTISESQSMNVVVTIIDQTSPKVWADQAIVIDTYGYSSAEHRFNLDQATQDVNVIQISGDTTAADNLEADYDGTGYNKSASTIGTTTLIAANGIAVGSIAVNAINSSALATTAAEEIADQVWDELRSAHTVAGSFGQGMASVQGNVTGSVGSVATGGITSGSFAAGAVNAAAIATDAITAAKIAANAIGASELATDAVAEIWAGSTAPTAASIADSVWDEATTGHTTAGTFGEQLKTDVDAILVDTAEIGAAGAGLSAVPWNAAWDAEVQSECTDALNAYDPPTKGELDTAESNIRGVDSDTLKTLSDQIDALNDASAASIADAVWDEATAGHTSAGTFGEQVKTDIDAILADTGTDGVVLANDAITAAKIATDAIGADELAADAVAEIQSGLATSANQATILNRLGAFTGTGVNTVLGFFQALFRTDASTPSDIGGTYNPATDALEALNDDLDAILDDTGSSGVVIHSDTQIAIADALLKRDWGSVSSEADRSVLNALRFLRNKWTVAAGTLTVTKEDDTTTAWTGAVTTDAAANPVTGNDPT